MSEEEIVEEVEARAEKKARVKPAKPKGKITAHEIYQTLKDILAGRAATPMVLADTGEGLYIVSEPAMTGEEELLYAYILRKLIYCLLYTSDAADE